MALSNSTPLSRLLVLLKYAVALVAFSCAVLSTPAIAQIPTGENSICCAYILNSANSWQLVCNRPDGVSLDI
jgi:hypothetical protein